MLMCKHQTVMITLHLSPYLKQFSLMFSLLEALGIDTHDLKCYRQVLLQN